MYSVQSEFISHIYDLSDVTVTELLPVGVSTAETLCTILVGRACAEDERETLVSLELARLCPALRATDIITVLTQPTRALDTLYPGDGSSSPPEEFTEDPVLEQSDPGVSTAAPVSSSDGDIAVETSTTRQQVANGRSQPVYDWEPDHAEFQGHSENLPVANDFEQLTLSPGSPTNFPLGSEPEANTNGSAAARSTFQMKAREGCQGWQRVPPTRSQLSSSTVETLSTSSITTVTETETLSEQSRADTRHPSLPPTEEQEYAGILGEIAVRPILYSLHAPPELNTRDFRRSSTSKPSCQSSSTPTGRAIYAPT